MPGSHAEEIVGDYFDPDDWAESCWTTPRPSRISTCRRCLRLVLSLARPALAGVDSRIQLDFDEGAFRDERST